jgi:hypothetical protein
LQPPYGSAQSGTMRSLHPVVALSIGAMLGLSATVPAWVFRAQSLPPAAAHQNFPVPEKSERSALATKLMGRIAPRFVSQETEDDGVVFYDQPTPYGDAVCRVRSYAFAGRVVEGHPEREDHRPIENLTVSDLYGLWAEPGTAKAQSGDRDRNCARFRDFNHLISGSDGIAVMRATTVLADAIREARSGEPRFKVTCLDRREDRPVICDGVILLRQTSIRDVLQVEPIWTDYAWDDPAFTSKATGATYLDRVDLRAPTNGRACGQTETLTFRLETRQTFGRHSAMEGEAKSLMIWRDVIC